MWERAGSADFFEDFLAARFGIKIDLEAPSQHGDHLLGQAAAAFSACSARRR